MNFFIKKTISRIFKASGLIELKIAKRTNKKFLILMYHRIFSFNTEPSMIQPGMYVMEKTLELHLDFLNRYFTIWPLSRLNGVSFGKESQKKPICFITFDDGWRDFYDVAQPVLKAYSAHATVFLPTGFIGTTKSFWTDRLLHIFQTIDQEKAIYLKEAKYKNRNTGKIVSLQGSYEEKTEKAISFLKELREEETEEILSELSKKLKLDEIGYGRAFLNWDEIKEMKRSGLIEFGSHTVSHKILKNLKESDINYELIESKETLIRENVNDGKFIPFCYPSGVYDRKIEKMVEDAGYALAVSTQKGWNSMNAHPFTLRRIGIHQDMTNTKSMFACRIAGLI